MNPGFFLIINKIIAYTFAFMSWSINSARSANHTYNDDLYKRTNFKLRAKRPNDRVKALVRSCNEA